MVCSTCGWVNPAGSRFCNQCGSQLDLQQAFEHVLYGVFNRGGYGDGYYSPFRFTSTIFEAMQILNSPASLSLDNTNQEKFLASISAEELHPTDEVSYITSRWKVHHWWTLEWSGSKWQIVRELSEHPTSLGLSPFESK